MPIKTPSNPPLPMARLQALRGSQPVAFFDKFIAQGSAENTYDGRSIYVPKPIKNGISEPGAIFINPHDVTSLANAIVGLPYLKAYDSILLHELGHAFYATRVALDYQTDPAKILDWCYKREALASLFVFNYLVDRGITGGSLVVPGPGIPADLYSLMAASVAGLTPGSIAYENAAIALAKAKYQASPEYRKVCEGFAAKGGLPPGFYPPPAPTEGGGGSAGGGGGGGGGGSLKIPSGYWREVPSE